MPKKSNSVSKSQRIESLRKILERWGRLNKQQIDHHVAAQLDLDEASVSRTLYRDLEELVNNLEVRAYYFNRDGASIEEYDPEIHKNTYCEWSLIGSESQVVGQDILKKNGALLLASERLNKLIKIDSGQTGVDFKIMHIFFNIPSHYLCLKISREIFPFTVVIGRIPAGNINPQTVFNALEKEYGKRIIMLSLPFASISSFKVENGQMGHAVVRFDNDLLENNIDTMTISDLMSKNKTFHCKLSQVEADTLRKTGGAAIDKTLTEGWNYIKKSDLNLKKIEVKKKVVVQSPSLIFVSEQIPILIL